ncbi:MAG: serine hydrolase [Desulfobulbaceae bacterium]|nr:serine hydrolase [Desulfobulbaceae bacterium]
MIKKLISLMAIPHVFSKNAQRTGIFFFCVFWALVLLVFPISANKSSAATLLASSHKFAPKDMQQPGRAENAKKKAGDAAVGCIITRSAGMKRKPASSARTASVRKLVSTDRLRKKLSSRSAIVVDSVTGEILYSHDPDRPAQPASTIKVLTGLIAIRSLQDDEKVTASRRASRMPSSKIYIEEGTSYKANDLINAVLLASANDASVALAEKVAGSEKSFAKLMTHKAKILGAQHTVCKTATGLTARGQQSTVRDLAVVFDKAMQNKEFARRMSKSKVRTSYGKLLRNHNKALWRVKGAVGGKTGYTRAARQTYVGKFSRDNADIVVAIMGSETMWDDISRLVDYGFARKEQLIALRKSPAQTIDSTNSAVAMAELSPAFRNRSLQVLSGTKKHSSL